MDIDYPAPDQLILRLLFDHDTDQRVYVRDYRYGSRVLSNETREELFEWCFENCRGRFWIGMGFGVFDDESDKIMFKLRWS